MGSSTVAQAKLGSNEAKSTEWIQMILQDGLRRGAVEHQSDSSHWWSTRSIHGEPLMNGFQLNEEVLHIMCEVQNDDFDFGVFGA